MAVNTRIAEMLERLTFEQREEGYNHHTHSEDMLQNESHKRGDPRALEVGKRMFESGRTGFLSDDPLRNYQYLFVACITLACRFCIEGGLPEQESYNLSDLYILQADRCATVEAVFALRDAMFRDYLSRMQRLQRRDVFSRQVYRCMDYIGKHLQQPLTVAMLAKELELSPAYLSVLFKKETGLAVSEYIRRKRVETARTLLQYTDFSCLEIAEYLCFSSDSHFSRVFREHTGQTPSEFRRQNYRRHWEDGTAE